MQSIVIMDLQTIFTLRVITWYIKVDPVSAAAAESPDVMFVLVVRCDGENVATVLRTATLVKLDEEVPGTTESDRTLMKGKTIMKPKIVSRVRPTLDHQQKLNAYQNLSITVIPK